MEVLYKVCCGLDVHKKKLVACLKKKGKRDVIKEFGEETKDIIELAEWLKENKCEKVAMESTASYWKSLWNIFEIKEVPTMVINAKEYKNVPGKKELCCRFRMDSRFIITWLIKRKLYTDKRAKRIKRSSKI